MEKLTQQELDDLDFLCTQYPLIRTDPLSVRFLAVVLLCYGVGIIFGALMQFAFSQ